MPRGTPQSAEIPTEAIPQANSLATLRRIVELVATGTTSTHALGEGADLSPRHVRYYLLAAHTLGWVDTAGNDPTVTARGSRLLAAPAGSASEINEIAASIVDSDVLRRTAGIYLLEPETGVDELTTRLATSTGLSPATAHRRASCLVAWRTQLVALGWRPATAQTAPPAAPILSEPPVTEHTFNMPPPERETKAVLEEATPLAAVVLNQIPAFKYVTEDHAPVYRAIVQVFFAAKQRYVIELRPTDVTSALTAGAFHAPLATPEERDYHLGKLVEWGNLSRAHDTATVATIEDFYKKSFVYHLSAVGEAAHRAVIDVEATVGRSGSLQSNMLLKIRDALRELAGAGAIDPEHALRLLHDLFAAFDTLTEEAARFIGEITESFGADRIEEEHFVLRKQALVAYISRFVDQLRKLSSEIAAGVRAVEARGVEPWLAAAAASTDLPPALRNEDPRAAWLEDRRSRWTGMRGWFTAVGGAAPTVERLAGVAVEAILGLTRALGRLNDRRTRPVDRQADYLTLARWFGACATLRDAHALYEAAFGLYGARHFHIAEDDPDLARPGESWWDTAPVAVPVSLRARGTLSKAGRPAPAADHEASKLWIAQRQRRERDQIETALRRFAGKGELCLSNVASVDDAELDLLLALLDEALTAPRRADGSRSTRTADGRLSVTLRPPFQPAAWIELHTPRGRLRCRDHRIEVADTRAARRRGEEVAS